MTDGIRRVNTVKTALTTLVESVDGKTAAPVDKSDANYSVAREELVRRAEV